MNAGPHAASLDAGLPPPLLADLDGLGEPAQAAAGHRAGRPWQGCVTVEQLRTALAAG